MASILVTGGPVHAQLDDVKIITNKFRGGRMAKLAEDLVKLNYRVFYLTAKHAQPDSKLVIPIIHDGFDEYERLARSFAATCDAVVLGAAIPNLIPAERIVGKFPSHNYRPGDIVRLDFKIAPRIIDSIGAIKPKHSHLFGFKLLSNADHNELIDAAYDIVIESGATTIFANDRKDLSTKYAVTKERSIIRLAEGDLAKFIHNAITDCYYTTELRQCAQPAQSQIDRFKKLVGRYQEYFVPTKHGHIFGSVACRCGDIIITTARGKQDLNDHVFLANVDHDKRIVTAWPSKPTLNAPLLHKIFQNNPGVKSIVHYHQQRADLPTLPYAFPGTVKDSLRSVTRSFNIESHGCYLLIDQDGMIR